MEGLMMGAENRPKTGRAQGAITGASTWSKQELSVQRASLSTR